MSIITELLGSTLLGTVTGLIGNGITAFTNIKVQKMKNEHEVNIIQAETNAMIAETQANIEIAKTKIEGELDLSDNEIRLEAITQEGKRSISSEILTKLLDSKWTAWLGSLLVLLLGIVDVLKALIRPGLTYYFVFITSWLTLMCYDIITANGQIMSIDRALDLFDNLTNNIIFLTVTIVIWWFADRKTKKS